MIFNIFIKICQKDISFFVNDGTVHTLFKELSHNTRSLSLLHCHKHLLEALLVTGVNSDSLHPAYLVQANLVDTVTKVQTLCFQTPKPGTKVHNVTVQDFQSAVLVFDFP